MLQANRLRNDGTLRSLDAKSLRGATIILGDEAIHINLDFWTVMSKAGEGIINLYIFRRFILLVWQFLCVIGIAFVILEIFTPSMFFLNFALAAFITAAVSFITLNKFALVLVFFLLSFLSFAFLRPILLRRNSKDTETGMGGKYIGKTAKVTEDVTAERGVITIYGERWDARCENGEIIPAGAEVKILRNDSLIMYVTKI